MRPNGQRAPNEDLTLFKFSGGFYAKTIVFVAGMPAFRAIPPEWPYAVM
jgi:hypothetical protein